MKQADQQWYSTALEKLNPLRYHLNELIESAEAHNRFADLTDVSKLRTRPIIEAKIALAAVEEFFTGVEIPNDAKRKVCDRFTEIVATNLHSFENFDPAQFLSFYATLALQNDAIHRYQIDAVFHAKVTSVVAQLLRALDDRG